MTHPPRRILYIDDDEGLRRLVEKLLGRRGHSVATAASGPEGVARAAAERFDINYIYVRDSIFSARCALFNLALTLHCTYL